MENPTQEPKVFYVVCEKYGGDLGFDRRHDSIGSIPVWLTVINHCLTIGEINGIALTPGLAVADDYFDQFLVAVADDHISLAA